MAARLSAARRPDFGTLLPLPGCPTFGRPAGAETLSASERIDLDRLRWMALRSQLTPRPDLEQACFLLAGETGVSFERFSIAFFRGLAAQSRRKMVFYRPGAVALSEDEVWLMRLLGAWRRGEAAGAGALVAWRVEPAGQRWLRFLSAGVARTLSAVAA